MTANKFGLFLIPPPPPPPPPPSQCLSPIPKALYTCLTKRQTLPPPLCVTPSMNDP